MKHFTLHNGTIATFSVTTELIRNQHLWDQNTMRTSYSESPHHKVSDIILRFDKDPQRDFYECEWLPASNSLPNAKLAIMELMSRVRGTRLGRCLITRLAPGMSIPEHVDGGPTATYYERFHVPLQSAAGSIFKCGDEMVHMQTGEIWQFDNHVDHSIHNGSSIDRIHLVVDIRL